MAAIRGRMGRRMLVTAGMAAALLTVGLQPALAAPAGAPEPTVTITAVAGDYAYVTDCKGRDRSHLISPATVRITRAGSTAGDLPVEVTWSGDLVEGGDPGSPITIPDGAASTTVEVGDTPGFAHVAIVDSAGYAVGEPSAADPSIQMLAVDLACNFGGRVYANTVVGGTPPRITIRNWPSPEYGRATLDIDGTEPPGLHFQKDGTWKGAATTEGTWRFTAYYCSPDDECFDSYDITVTVGTDQGPLLPPPPATPVPTESTFTG